MATTDKDFDEFMGVCREAVAQQVSGRTEAFQSFGRMTTTLCS